MRRAAAVALVLLPACGGGDDSTTSAPAPTRSEAQTQPWTETATATEPRTATTTTGATTTTTDTSPEKQPGGAGDEEGPRVPAKFTYRDGKLTPPVIMVPATFRIAVSIAFPGGGSHRVQIGDSGTVEGAASGVTVTLPGLAKGKAISIRVDGSPAGRIVSGLQPGP